MKAKRIRAVLGAGVIACAGTAFGGCGGTPFDVMSTAEITFSDYSGQANQHLREE
ncbi:MAG: hypothetical protein J6A16_04300 [Oscillospiraceae bacterium]|nr:hypothetical protein [Oscillospiraceae bacterium]